MNELPVTVRGVRVRAAHIAIGAAFLTRGVELAPGDILFAARAAVEGLFPSDPLIDNLAVRPTA